MVFLLLSVCLVTATAFNVGDNLEGVIPFTKKLIVPYTYDQRRAEIALTDVGGLLGSNASTRINSIGLVDSTYNVIASYTDDDQYAYVDEGEILGYILCGINVSTALVDNQTDAMNNTRVYLIFMPTGEDPIATGYMYAVSSAQYSDDCYYILFSAYVPYTFDAGTYIIYTEYDVRY